MRNIISKALIGVAVFMLSMTMASAAPNGFTGSSAANAHPLVLARWNGGESRSETRNRRRRARRRSRYCEDLRLACKYKDRLGERGQGNCRRYRNKCGDTGRSYCSRLRWKCLHKDEIDGRGRGHCRRYRRKCRR